MTVVVLGKDGRPANLDAARLAIWQYVKALIEAEHPGIRVELKGGERSEIGAEKKVGQKLARGA